MIIVRYADDYLVGFEHHRDAHRFLADLRDRFAKFCLELAPNKTRLIQFGRFAARDRASRGQGKPETFDFLGFKHCCSKTKNGRFMLKRITIAKRMQAKLREVKDELRRRRHHSIPDQGRWLASVLRGHYAYYAVPGNSDAINALLQPSHPPLVPVAAAPQPAHKGELDAHATHPRPMAATPETDAPLPQRALRRPHPRQEPSALTGHAGICAGGRPQACMDERPEWPKGGPYRDDP